MTVSDRIKLGVSSCLLGDKVRYDGKHKYFAGLYQGLSDEFVFQGFCPEVAVGMGVPRPPIQLVQCQQGIEACDVVDSNIMWTQQLTDYAQQEAATHIAKLSGFIFKKNSPSCAPGALKIFDTRGRILHQNGVGIFANVIQQQFPQLPVIDETGFADAIQRDRFVQDVRVFYQKSLM